MRTARRSTHAAPHNLYVRPALLPAGTGPAQPVLSFGAVPHGGTPATDRTSAIRGVGLCR
jgi:hypothetical protein